MEGTTTTRWLFGNIADQRRMTCSRTTSGSSNLLQPA